MNIWTLRGGKTLISFLLVLFLLIPFLGATDAYAEEPSSVETSENKQEEVNNKRDTDIPSPALEESVRDQPEKTQEESIKQGKKEKLDKTKNDVVEEDNADVGADFSIPLQEEEENCEKKEDEAISKKIQEPALPISTEEAQDDKFSFFTGKFGYVICLAVSVFLLAIGGAFWFVFRARKRILNSSETGAEFDFHMIIPLGPIDDPVGSLWATSSSIIGTRAYQQDCIKTPRLCSIPDFLVEEKGYFCVLCDGMGGLENGERASNMCTQIMMEAIYSSPETDIFKQIKYSTDLADERVHSLKDKNGENMKCGTTMVCAYIKDGKLFYANVGDSRLYLCRNGKLLLLSKDHNYYEELLGGEPVGSPQWEQANSNPKKEALTSYIGMGGLRHYDCAQSLIELEENDIIILCSDGLYRVLSESEMLLLISQYGEHLEFLPHVLTAAAMDKNKVHQDNTSVITIKYIKS